MKFREHRGSFQESMSTVVEVADRAALLAHMRQLLAPWPSAPLVTNEAVEIKPYYGIDARNGWDTHYRGAQGLWGFWIHGFSREIAHLTLTNSRSIICH